jgi:1-acyl-sn-glycerol-3-phosphate acyltransferase
MIRAQKNRSFEHIFQLLNRGLLYHHFHSIQMRISATSIDLDRPTVYFVNHSNWWDALFVFQLNYSILRQQAYGMMSEEGLKQFAFFRKLGVFSVNRHSLRDVKASMDYSIEILQTAGNSLWIFPQGDVFHQDTRPLTFLPGLGYLFEKCSHVQWVPVTFYFSYGTVRQPDAYIEIGSPFIAEEKPSRTALSRSAVLESASALLTQQLDKLRQDVIYGQGQLQDFQPIWQGLKPTKVAFEPLIRKTKS